MTSDLQVPRVPARPTGIMARLPTGAKLLLILSAALLPLALIGVAAALQTTRSVDVRNRAELRVAAVESARTIAIELIGDMTALQAALEALEKDPADTPSCARARGVLALATTRGVRFGILDAQERLRCGTVVDDRGMTLEPGAFSAELVSGRGLLMSVGGREGSARASVFFPASFLAEVGRPSVMVEDYGADLVLGEDRLTLRASARGLLTPHSTMRAPVGIEGLSLDLSRSTASITSPMLVAMLLPILMWVAAAAIAWFVVDRLLVLPLRQLRTAIAGYVPGSEFTPSIGAMPAQEIRDLGDTFGGLSRTIAAHESDLAEGLVRQTKLTREVHHRVKNNLQVIASLINFHARSAASPEVTAAYASIQRRVDALAVVHRNHYAELEVHRGLGLRPVISELAANIRANAPQGGPQLSITLEIEPFLANQDSAVAMTFLITELVELAMSANPAASLNISLRGENGTERAALRVSSPALVETDTLRQLLTERYGRVIEGLARQLRSKLHHDPLAGAYEISVAVIGRE